MRIFVNETLEDGRVDVRVARCDRALVRMARIIATWERWSGDETYPNIAYHCRTYSLPTRLTRYDALRRRRALLASE